jgi:hypothetical protein
VSQCTFQIPDGDRTPHGGLGATVDVSNIDGGHSWILRQHLPGARCRHFLTLIVDTLESLTAPTKGPAINVS